MYNEIGGRVGVDKRPQLLFIGSIFVRQIFLAQLCCFELKKNPKTL